MVGDAFGHQIGKFDPLLLARFDGCVESRHFEKLLEERGGPPNALFKFESRECQVSLFRGSAQVSDLQMQR